jgi:glycosyltransferase involved in cell wall biosynthesis
MRRLNILVSAYYCDPKKGSESSVGWNFSKCLAVHHNVYVFTKASNRDSIETELADRPVKGIHFVYYDFPNFKFFNENILGEQIAYLVWQLLLFSTYRRVAGEVQFDLVHHLTFNQYRTPSIGFFIKKPFVMGPIGGAEMINPVFFPDLSLKTSLKERWRSLGLDRYLFGLLVRLRPNRKIFIFSSNENKANLSGYLLKENKAVVIPAIGINRVDFKQYPKDNIAATEDGKPFVMIYAGIAKDWKGIKIFLRAVEKAFICNESISVKLIGIRDESERERVISWIKEFNLTDIVEVVSFMPRQNLIEELRAVDLCIYPAFRDSGSMSVLEGCALGCAVLCFDVGGQDAFAEDILLKVPVSGQSYESNVVNLADKLLWSFNNRSELSRIGSLASTYVFEQFGWEKKVESFCELYDEVLDIKRSLQPERL